SAAAAAMAINGAAFIFLPFYLRGGLLRPRRCSQVFLVEPWSAGDIPHAGAPPRRRRGIDAALSAEDDAVVALRRLARDEAVRDIGGDALRRALARIAEAAAARQLEADRVARRHGLPPLGADRPAGDQRHPPGLAGAAAVAPARGIADALEIAEEADRRAACARQLDH